MPEIIPMTLYQKEKKLKEKSREKGYEHLFIKISHD